MSKTAEDIENKISDINFEESDFSNLFKDLEKAKESVGNEKQKLELFSNMVSSFAKEEETLPVFEEIKKEDNEKLSIKKYNKRIN